MIWNPEYECMDREELRALQLRRLQMSVSWVYERVPYYRTKLEEMIAFTEVAGCRTQSLLGCFGEDLSQPCGHCDNCVPRPETGKLVDVSTQARDFLSSEFLGVSAALREALMFLNLTQFQRDHV